MSSSLLDYLTILGLENITDLSLGDLKKAFRKRVLQVHPDKGGKENDFDYLLSAFVYINNALCHVKGGRTSLEEVKTPDELKAEREPLDEFIEAIFDEFNREHFNKEFEKVHISDLNEGYSQWLSSDSDKKVENGIETKNGFLDYQQLLKQTPIPKPKKVGLDHSVFVQEAKKGKPEPQSIILHPNAMAYHQFSLVGSDIIGLGERPDSYTCDMLTKPRIIDLYQAYTNENTICDKIPDTFISRTYDDILNERKKEIKPFTDDEKSALYEYERKELDKEKQRINKVNETYKTNYKYNTTFLENHNVCSEGDFIIDIK